MGEKDTSKAMDINGETNWFFTLKVHEENFMNNHTVCLINPAKNLNEQIKSYFIKSTTILKLTTSLKLHQWKNALMV